MPNEHSSHEDVPNHGSIVLDVRDARKQFDQTHALSGAGFALHRGEWLALLGPNGAGKTTLVRAVAGRVRLDSGQMTLLGTPLSTGNGQSRPQVRARLGLVSQEIALYDSMSAAENLTGFGRLNGLSGTTLHDRVQWALSWTGLAERAREQVKRFSGGMKRRLNLACGVLHKPEVILLDEPTVGVDPQSRQRIWEMLDSLRRDGASLLLTTHQLDEAQQLADRIVIIDHGKTIADGMLGELIEQTVGPTRTAVLQLDHLPDPLPQGVSYDDTAPVHPAEPGAAPDDDDSNAPPAPDQQGSDAITVTAELSDLAAELPDILSALSATGCRVLDLKIREPSLHAVFLHLTGRELRG